MKVAVYLAMLLLLGPLLRFAGVVISALFLVAMFGIGLCLIFHRKDRSDDGPPHPVAPQVVVVVPPEHWPWPPPPPPQEQWPAAEPVQVRATHPARRPREDRPPLWLRPGQ